MAAFARSGLYAGTIAALLLGGALLLLVLERVHAAGLQWFKFGAAGHITLSQSTSHMFYGILAGTVTLSGACYVLARREALRGLTRVTVLAGGMAVSAGLLYFLLGASQFNVWRA